MPPDPYEPSLIAYAMGARGGVELEPMEREPNEAVRLEAPESPDGQRLRVAITGAFLTGHPLAVRAASYGDLQRSLARSLRGPQWRIEGLHARDGTYESGGGFTEAPPLIIARRDGADLVPGWQRRSRSCGTPGRVDRIGPLGALRRGRPVSASTSTTSVWRS